MPFEITSGSNKDIAPGTYKATLTEVSIKETESPPGSGTITQYRLWDFLADVNGQLTPVSGTSSLNTGPKSKAYQWLTALIGKAPQAGETIEDPIGKMVLLTISRKDNGFPKIDLLTAYVEPVQTEAGIPR